MTQLDVYVRRVQLCVYGPSCTSSVRLQLYTWSDFKFQVAVQKTQTANVSPEDLRGLRRRRVAVSGRLE